MPVLWKTLGVPPCSAVSFPSLLLTSAMCLLCAPVMFTSCSAGSGLACPATASDLASALHYSGMLECSIGQHGWCVQRRAVAHNCGMGCGARQHQMLLALGPGHPSQAEAAAAVLSALIICIQQPICGCWVRGCTPGRLCASQPCVGGARARFSGQMIWRSTNICEHH